MAERQIHVAPLMGGPNVQERIVLDAYNLVARRFGPDVALDTLVTVLANKSVERMGRTRTIAKLIEFTEKIP